ncbi:hypothetical protein [Larkinella soli]|uniref:hypothetical protein n=1 Tax=Larkinella soli TaxID=1770527 RepID=UPI000FFC7FC4|nr:hypothetical protein [Larkinella soli]
MSLKSLEIRYQSAQSVPPPYSNFYTMIGRTDPSGGLAVAFSITYTDRDEIDEDEIIGEGFTGDDDYAWTGTLPGAWQRPLEDLIGKTRLRPFDEDRLGTNDDYFQVTIEMEGKAVETGSPARQEDWIYLAQELIQAVYEASGKEKPFEMTYLEKRGSQRSETRLTAWFSKREAQLQVRQGERNQSDTLSWAELRSLMEIVYAVDYDPDSALPGPPKQDGQFLNLGTEEWFDLSAQALGNDGPATRLRQTLKRLATAPDS